VENWLESDLIAPRRPQVHGKETQEGHHGFLSFFLRVYFTIAWASGRP
jgi:hypothetical protein